MERVEIDALTGEKTVITLTAEDVADAQARTAAAQPTPDQIKAALVSAVQAHLDAIARATGYDNIYTACTYADEPVVTQFQAEGKALRAWRSRVWAYCHQVLADVQAERRGVPSTAVLIGELPTVVL